MNNAVKFEIVDQVGIITLNRPSKLNAINQALALGLLNGLKKMNADPACKLIVLYGEGNSFCAGDDLQELSGNLFDLKTITQGVEVLQNITREIMFNDKLVLCAVQGWAIGAGFSWVLNADMSFWASDAGVFLPEMEYGLFATGAATFILPNRIGPEKAIEMMASGKKYSADDLRKMGLLGETVPPEKLIEEIFRVADDLKKYSENALRDIKHGLLHSIRQNIEDALSFEAKKAIENIKLMMASDAIKNKTLRFK